MCWAVSPLRYLSGYWRHCAQVHPFTAALIMSPAQMLPIICHWPLCSLFHFPSVFHFSLCSFQPESLVTHALIQLAFPSVFEMCVLLSSMILCVTATSPLIQIQNLHFEGSWGVPSDPSLPLDLCLEPGALKCSWNYIGINTEIDVVMDMDGDTHTCMQSQQLWHEDTLAALCRGPCGEELRPPANCQCTLVIGSHLGGAVTLEPDPSPPVKTSDEPSQHLTGFAWDTWSKSHPAK